MMPSAEHSSAVPPRSTPSAGFVPMVGPATESSGRGTAGGPDGVDAHVEQGPAAEVGGSACRAGRGAGCRTRWRTAGVRRWHPRRSACARSDAGSGAGNKPPMQTGRARRRRSPGPRPRPGWRRAASPRARACPRQGPQRPLPVQPGGQQDVDRVDVRGPAAGVAGHDRLPPNSSANSSALARSRPATATSRPRRPGRSPGGCGAGDLAAAEPPIRTGGCGRWFHGRPPSPQAV